MQSKEGDAPRGLAQLWGLAPQGTRGPRARHTVHDVAAAGVALAGRSGLEAVTLAAVAAELGVTTTALYRYVDTKEVLIELMVDAAIGEPPPIRGVTWEERARAWALALGLRYRRHPWLAAVANSGVPRRPSLFAWTAALIDALADGPPGLDAMHIALVLDAVVRGLATLGSDASPPPRWLGPAVAARFPQLTDELARDWTDVDAEVDAAVDLVLAGVAAQHRTE